MLCAEKCRCLLQKKLIDEIWRYIVRYYVNNIPDTEEEKYDCFQKSLSAGISYYLKDAYSAYYIKKDIEEYKISSEGDFQGVGLSLATYHNRVIVVSPIRGTPAWESGMFRPGDVIAEVDGEKCFTEINFSMSK